MIISLIKKNHPAIRTDAALALSRIGKKYPFCHKEATKQNEDFWALKDVSFDIAKGEVVVEKEKYGIRIVEVVSRKERVKSFW